MTMWQTAGLVPFRGGGFNPVPRRVLPWIVFAVLIALWQAASSSGPAAGAVPAEPGSPS